MDFCWEYTVWKNRTTFSDVPLLPEISRWNNPKSRVPLVNGKQPYFQHYILLVEAIYI